MTDLKAHILTLAAFAVLLGGGLGAIKLGLSTTEAVAFISALGAVAYRMQSPATGADK